MAKGIISNKGGLTIERVAGGADIVRDEVLGQTGVTITFPGQTYVYNSTGVQFYRNGVLMDKVASFSGGTNNSEEYQEVNNGAASNQITLNPTDPATADERFEMVFFSGELTGAVEVNQASHGFAVLDAIYHDGLQWSKAQADSEDTVAQFVITQVPDSDNFTAYQFGQVDIAGHGRTPGETYYLSETSAGLSQIAEPLTGFSQPLFRPIDAGSVIIQVYRASSVGSIVGDVDTLTQITAFDTSDGLTNESTGVNGATLRLTHDPSVTKFAEKTVDVTEKFRDKLLALEIDLASTATSGNFKVIITDETNAKTLADEQLAAQTESETVKRRVTFSTKPGFGESAIAQIKVRFEALAESGAPTSDFDDVIVKLHKLSLTESIVEEKEENNFGAYVAHNAGSPTVSLQNIPWITSVSYTPTQYIVNFVPGFFTVPPAVTAMPEITSANVRIPKIDSITTSSMVLRWQNQDATLNPVSAGFWLKATRMGSDYRPVTNRVEKSETVLNEVVIEENDIYVEASDNSGETLTANVTDIPFSTITRDSDNAWNGTQFTTPEDGIYTISGAWRRATSGGMNLKVFINGLDAALTIGFGGTTIDMFHGEIYLNEGDILSLRSDGGLDLVPTLPQYHYIRIHKKRSLKALSVAPESKVEIPNSSFKLRDHTGNGGPGEDNTVQFNLIDELKGDAFSINNSNGTVITILKDGILDVSASVLFTGPSITLYITKNAANPDGAPAVNERLATAIADTAGTYANVACTAPVKTGDIIRVSSTGTAGNSSGGIFFASHQEQQVQVAVSNIEPQFEDVESMVRVSGFNAMGATSPFIPRFSTLQTNLGSAITYVDDFNDGASFQINEDGTYAISYSNNSGTNVQASAGITLNETNITDDVIDTPGDELLALDFGQQSTGNTNASCAVTVKLSAGDIIRPGTRGHLPVSGNRCQFTITKVPLPSIAEVDITPFADLNQQVYQSTEWIPYYPAWNGGFAPTGVNVQWRRDGDSLEVMGTGITGNVNANSALFGLPQGLKIDVSKAANKFLIGEWIRDVNSGGLQDMRLRVVSSDPNNVYLTTTGSAGITALSLVNWDQMFGNGESFSFKFKVPIEGWANYDSEYTRVYSVEDNENVFSARIANNGTASVISQSLPFIQNATRVSPGRVQIDFVPGFFSEAPSSVAIDTEDQDNTAIQNISTSGLDVVSRNDAGSYTDVDFSIILQRQGADYKDLQRQIVELADFPRVNRTLTHSIRHNNTVTSVSGQLQFDPTNFTVDKNASLLEHHTDLPNGRSGFRALQDCVVDFSFTIQSVDGSDDEVQVAIYDTDDTTAIQSVGGTEMAHINYRTSTAGTFFLKKGQSIGTSTDGHNFAVNVQVSIVAQAQELERVFNIEEQTNVFSALINGGGSLNTSNVDWIDSVVSGGPNSGQYTINFKGGIFTQPPAIMLAIDDQGAPGTTVWSIQYNNVTATSVDVEIFINQGSWGSLDRNFSIMAQRQGDDYVKMKDIVVAVPETKVAYINPASVTQAQGLPGTTSYKTRALSGFGNNSDTSFISIGSNQMTLDAGRYNISVPIGSYNGALWVDVLLYNITDSVNQEELLELAYSSGDFISFNTATFTIEISEQKTFEFRTRCDVGGGSEYFGRVKVEKVS